MSDSGRLYTSKPASLPEHFGREAPVRFEAKIPPSMATFSGPSPSRVSWRGVQEHSRSESSSRRLPASASDGQNDLVTLSEPRPSRPDALPRSHPRRSVRCADPLDPGMVTKVNSRSVLGRNCSYSAGSTFMLNCTLVILNLVCVAFLIWRPVCLLTRPQVRVQWLEPILVAVQETLPTSALPLTVGFGVHSGLVVAEPKDVTLDQDPVPVCGTVKTAVALAALCLPTSNTGVA